MRKYTLKELRELVRLEVAYDLTNASTAEVMTQWAQG